jgi:ParB-like chromosome segregation protein Spo0J
MASKKYPRERRVDRGPIVEIGSLWLGPNPRTRIDEDALERLTQQVIQDGIREQLLVRRTDNPDGPGQHHQIWDGQRRWMAAQRAIERGHVIEVAPARIEPAGRTDAEMAFLAAQTTSGIGKEPLTPLDECRLIVGLLGYGLTQAAIAERLGMDPSVVSRRAKLRDTTPLVQAEVVADRMTVSKALQLAGKPQEEQDRAAADSKAGKKSARKAAPARPGKKAIRSFIDEYKAGPAHDITPSVLILLLEWVNGDATKDQVDAALSLNATRFTDAPPEVDPRQTTITNNPKPPARPAVPN